MVGQNDDKERRNSVNNHHIDEDEMHNEFNNINNMHMEDDSLNSFIKTADSLPVAAPAAPLPVAAAAARQN